MHVNQAAQQAGRPQDKITAFDILPMLPTNDVLTNQTVRGSEELGRSKVKHMFVVRICQLDRIESNRIRSDD